MSPLERHTSAKLDWLSTPKHVIVSAPANILYWL